MPLELQRMVWGGLLPEPTFHEIRFERGVEAHRTADDGDCGIPRTAAPPILLQICKGSRDFALLHYTKMFNRRSCIQAVGQWLNCRPSNGVITADTPGVKEYFEHRHSFSVEPENIIGLKTNFIKRSYVDLKRDTIYFNLYTFATNLEERGQEPSLRFLNWHIDLEDSKKIKHMTIDFAIWKSTGEIHDYFHPSNRDQFYGGEKLNDTHLRLWLLFKRGAFTNLKTLTLVVSSLHFLYRYFIFLSCANKL
jgi:2EXR family